MKSFSFQINFKLLALMGAFLILISSMIGCKNAPNDQILQTYTATDSIWTPVYDSTPVYVNGVAHNEYKVVKNVQLPIQRVTVEPSWGQAFHYAFKSGYIVWLIIGIILTLVGIAGFTLDQFDKLPFKQEPNPFALYGSLLAILALGLVSIYALPGNIRWNNKKDFAKSYYDNVIKTEGSSQRLWDSLEVNNLIVFAHEKK